MKILTFFSALVAFVQIIGVLVLFYFNINQYTHTRDAHMIHLLNAEVYHGHYSHLVLSLQVAVEVLILLVALVLLWGVRHKNTKCLVCWIFFNALVATIITACTSAGIYWVFHDSDPYYEKFTMYMGILTVLFWNKIWIIALYYLTLRRERELRYILM